MKGAATLSSSDTHTNTHTHTRPHAHAGHPCMHLRALTQPFVPVLTQLHTVLETALEEPRLLELESVSLHLHSDARTHTHTHTHAFSHKHAHKHTHKHTHKHMHTSRCSLFNPPIGTQCVLLCSPIALPSAFSTHRRCPQPEPPPPVPRRHGDADGRRGRLALAQPPAPRLGEAAVDLCPDSNRSAFRVCLERDSLCLSCVLVRAHTRHPA